MKISKNVSFALGGLGLMLAGAVLGVWLVAQGPLKSGGQAVTEQQALPGISDGDTDCKGGINYGDWLYGLAHFMKKTECDGKLITTYTLSRIQIGHKEAVTNSVNADGAFSAWVNSGDHCKLEPNSANNGDCEGTYQGVRCKNPPDGVKKTYTCEVYTCHFCASDRGLFTKAECDSREDRQIEGKIDRVVNTSREVEPGKSASCDPGGNWSY